MTFSHNDENIQEKLKDAEVAALKEYCKTQGFTEDEASTFIRNSITNLFNKVEI